MRFITLSRFIASVSCFFSFFSNALTVNINNQNVLLGFSPNEGAKSLVIESIQNAKSSIDMAALVITSDDIFNSLIEAHNRGVLIRIVVDANSANVSGSDVKALLDRNIQVKLNNKFRIMHNKYIVIDKKSVQTGSFNYSSNADRKNAENAIFLNDQPSIASIYTSNFEKLYADSEVINNINYYNLQSNFEKNMEEVFLNKDSSSYKSFIINNGIVDVAFSEACNYVPSSVSAKNLILQVIESAKQSIYLAAYGFSDPDIMSALKLSQKRGVTLNIILDYKSNFKNNNINELKSLGANIYLNKKFSIMHNKYIIADNNTLEIGSFNYTASADKDQCNNILVFYNQNSLVNNYMQDWQMLYETSIK